MMETDSNDSAPAPAPPVHAGFTMEQAQAHYNAAMAEVQPAPTPLSAFQQAQEEQRYNLFFLEQQAAGSMRLLILDFNANLVLYFECFYFLMFQEVDDQSILTEA